MDGEAEALHRQMHHNGCALFTAICNTGLVDNRGSLSPGAFVERRIITRTEWNHGGVTVYTDGALVSLHVSPKDSE